MSRKWITETVADRIYLSIEHDTGNINTVGSFSGSLENATYIVDTLNLGEASAAAKPEAPPKEQPCGGRYWHDEHTFSIRTPKGVKKMHCKGFGGS